MANFNFVLLALLLAAVYSQCPTGCSACSSPTQCTSCSARFFLVNGTQCAACPTGCSACNQGSNGRPACTACTAPAQLDSTAGRCFLCDPNCLTCGSSPTTCTSCRDGKELTSNNTCGAPAGCNITNCGNCTTDLAGNLVCERCIQGYFPFKQGCVPCKFPCSACNFDRNQVWLAVSAFWDPILRAALNVTVPTPTPGSLPSITNNLDFAGMNETLKQGWTEAFFVTTIAVNAYSSPSLFAASIPGHIRFYIDNQNRTTQEFYGLLVQRLSNITNKTWTLADFNNKLGLAASELTSCATCGAGFLVANNTCTRCPAGCEQCASGSCTVCRNGTFLSSGTCVPCASSCLTCSIAGNNCTSCASPASLVGNACLLCQQPCATCSPTNTSSCVACKKPFSKLANAGTCFRCDQDLCDKCDSTNTSICLLCRPGATLIEGRCQLCPANCSNCFVGTNSSICFQCLAGYELNITNNQTRCLPCGPGCRSCANKVCLECQSGTYLERSNGTCFKCKQGCIACSSLQTCTAYEKGMIIIGDKVVTCRPGCKTCDTPQVCTECEARYFLSSGICRQCEPGCSTCTDETVCTKCIDNLILASGNCTACAGNCRTCNSANVTQCQTCKRGFTLVGTQCVYQCKLGCLECDATNSSICITCAQGHSLRPDGRCIKCLGSCSGSCDPRNISICLSCVDGFELKQNQCVRCPLGCATCLVGQCSSCLTGYTLTQSTSGSFVCQEKCKPPCATCSGGVCSACETGFTFSNGRCNPDLTCNPNCDFCPAGTEKLSNGTCVACPTNCASCSNGVCLQCLKGFYLNSTSCAACPSKCKTCYNADTCDQCASGFVKEIVSMTSSIADAVFSDNCTACSSNCRTCIVEPDRCTSCPEGSRLKGSRCAGMFTVVYEYEVNIAYATFLDNSESDSFIETLSNMTNVNKSDNFIDYVREGSTVIGGTISTSSQTQASSVQSGLGSSVGGYSILSSSASVYYGDTAYTQQKTEQSKSSANVGLIVGVVVGGVVAIAIISFLIYKFKCQKTQVSQKQDSSSIEINQKY